MKKVLYCIAVLFIFSAGCNCGGEVVNNPPVNTEVEMASVAFDSIGAATSFADISRTTSLGSTQLNFLDKDSTRISFSYKGFSTLNDTLFYITAGASARLYTLNDNTVQYNTYKTVNVTVPSIKVNDLFTYTIKAQGVDPFITIKDLKIYKK